MRRPMFQTPQQRAGGGIMRGVAPVQGYQEGGEINPFGMTESSAGQPVSDDIFAEDFFNLKRTEEGSGMNLRDITDFLIANPQDPEDVAMAGITAGLMIFPPAAAIAHLARLGYKGKKAIDKVKKLKELQKRMRMDKKMRKQDPGKEADKWSKYDDSPALRRQRELARQEAEAARKMPVLYKPPAKTSPAAAGERAVSEKGLSNWVKRNPKKSGIAALVGIGGIGGSSPIEESVDESDFRFYDDPGVRKEEPEAPPPTPPEPVASVDEGKGRGIVGKVLGALSDPRLQYQLAKAAQPSEGFVPRNFFSDITLAGQEYDEKQAKIKSLEGDDTTALMQNYEFLKSAGKDDDEIFDLLVGKTSSADMLTLFTDLQQKIFDGLLKNPAYAGPEDGVSGVERAERDSKIIAQQRLGDFLSGQTATGSAGAAAEEEIPLQQPSS